MQSLSFVIPAKDEEGSVGPLYKEISEVMKKIKLPYQIIFVDDGSQDKTFQNLKKIKKQDRRVKVVRLRGNFGKSIALQTGFDEARGDIIFTLDADLQDNPREIGRFLKKISEGYDLVSGWKKVRHDPSLSKVLPSRILNSLTRYLTKVPIHDTNCGFKAYKKEVVKNLNLYGELYRFIPIIASKQNYLVGEIIVDHRPRKYGKTKYGWTRGVKGILDLLTIVFITGYMKRPGHFFGTLGLSSFTIGFLVGLYITYLRVTTGGIASHQPLLIFGLLLMIVGVQLISTGLLAEMMLARTNQKNEQKIIKQIL